MKKESKNISKEMKKQGFNIKLASEIKVYPKIKTNTFALDYLLDGGIYHGEGGHRIELYGKEGSCKTTIALNIGKTFQELNKKCVYINGESSYDSNWAEIIGVNNKKLYIAEPESLEQTGDMLEHFIGKYDLIIVDSVASLIPKEELEGTMVDNKHMASQAKVYSPMMRKLYSATKQFSPTIIFINQLREKVGIAYGNPYNTPGGRALKHFYNTRIEFRVGKYIQDKNKDRIGYEVYMNCVKNKRGKPHRIGVIDFYLNGHIDNNKNLFFAGLKYNIIEREGNGYTFKDTRIVGQDKFIENLEDKNWLKIEEEIWARIK